LILEQIPLISQKSKEFVGYIFLISFFCLLICPNTNLKNYKMMLRILPFLMLPLLGIGQTNSKMEMPMGKNTISEKQPLEIKRNATYNLEEIKVRWKKAALENCPGVPCTTSPACTAGTPSSSPTVPCGSNITPITIATTGATGIGSATGFPSGLVASWTGNVIRISGTPTTSGTFTYTIPLTGSCGGVVNATGTIIVQTCAM
jgi:hypothetical protein